MARHSQYPQIKVDEALLAYYTLGTYDKASEASEVPADTIRYWVNTSHTERYDELAEKHGPTLERRLIAKLARTADKAAAALDDNIDATSEATLSRNAKDAQGFSSAAKNIALVLGIATDKKLTLEGRPTHITEHRDLDDILKSLNTLVPGLVIEGTADEIPPAQQTLNQPAPDPIKRALHGQSRPNAREKQAA